MLRPRIIPVLLLQRNGLVKTVGFKNPIYIGDPFNAVKIFNDKGADELMLIDLEASAAGSPIDSGRLSEIASEAFMPVTYGGGIRSLLDIEIMIRCGIEKVLINTEAISNPEFINGAAKAFGSSTLSISVDYKSSILSRSNVTYRRGRRCSSYDPLEFCKRMEECGAGEILLHSVKRDGTQKGYDLELLKKVCRVINVPVVPCGGAAHYDDFNKALAAGASAAAAGSVFVFSGIHQAVLINYPSEAWRQKTLLSNNGIANF